MQTFCLPPSPRQARCSCAAVPSSRSMCDVIDNATRTELKESLTNPYTELDRRHMFANKKRPCAHRVVVDRMCFARSRELGCARCPPHSMSARRPAQPFPHHSPPLHLFPRTHPQRSSGVGINVGLSAHCARGVAGDRWEEASKRLEQRTDNKLLNTPAEPPPRRPVCQCTFGEVHQSVATTSMPNRMHTHLA